MPQDKGRTAATELPEVGQLVHVGEYRSVGAFTRAEKILFYVLTAPCAVALVNLLIFRLSVFGFSPKQLWILSSFPLGIFLMLHLPKIAASARDEEVPDQTP